MSSSIPSMSVIICEQDMQLKIINQNKLKPQNLLFEKHTLVFPAVALFLYLCAHSASSTLLSFVVFLPAGERLQSLPQCLLHSLWGEEQKSWSGFFTSCCPHGVREGWKDKCGSAGSLLPWNVSWPVVGLCADTWGPLCSSFSSNISSVLWTEGSLR